MMFSVKNSLASALVFATLSAAVPQPAPSAIRTTETVITAVIVATYTITWPEGPSTYTTSTLTSVPITTASRTKQTITSLVTISGTVTGIPIVIDQTPAPTIQTITSLVTVGGTVTGIPIIIDQSPTVGKPTPTIIFDPYPSFSSTTSIPHIAVIPSAPIPSSPYAVISTPTPAGTRIDRRAINSLLACKSSSRTRQPLTCMLTNDSPFLIQRAARCMLHRFCLNVHG